MLQPNVRLSDVWQYPMTIATLREMFGSFLEVGAAQLAVARALKHS